MRLYAALGLLLYSLPLWAGTELVLVPTHTNGFERNFNPFEPTVGVFYAQDFIYEPLWVFNVWDPDNHYPRLAESVAVSDDLTRLVYHLRDGVKWSDGTPFTARDVVFTVNYARQHPDYAINIDLYSPASQTGLIESVRQINTLTVEFTLSQPNAQAHYHIGRLYPLPQHIFSTIDNPAGYANANPVGTGPFTQVDRFTTTYFNLCRNPHYYVPDKPSFDCLKFPHYSGNERLWAAARRGKINWMGEGLRHPEQTFTRHNDHNQYWLAPGPNVNLQLNTQRPPLDDVEVRRAISLAINRDQLLTTDTFGLTSKTMYPVGTGPLYRSWYDEAALDPYKHLMEYDPDAARERLDAAGYVDRDGDGYRDFKDGRSIELSLAVPSGWTDWVNSVFTIAANLRDIGIQARVHSMDEQAWFERIPSGDFDIYIMWVNTGLTPWRSYQEMFNPERMQPGNLSNQAMHQYRDRDIEHWLNDFALTLSRERQQDILTKIQIRVAETLPVISLFANPIWYQYNDQDVVGWVDEQNPYIRPMVSQGIPERLIHVLNLRPRQPSSTAKAKAGS